MAGGYQLAAATVNELTCTYWLNGGRWIGTLEREYLRAKAKVPEPVVIVQQDRGKVMADAVRGYLAQQVGSPRVQMAQWVGRQGTLDRLVEGVSAAHPADIVVGLSNGSYWGVSAKSGDTWSVPLRNPGMGTIETAIGVSIAPAMDKVMDKLVIELGCPASAVERKIFIRNNPAIQEVTRGWGQTVLTNVRDVTFKCMSKWSPDERQHFIRDTLLITNAYPTYVHVTGFGEGKQCRALVVNPSRLQFSNVQIEMSGNNGIIFADGTQRIASLRVKFESEPLASSLKWSVES